jgi:hypothetical protein
MSLKKLLDNKEIYFKKNEKINKQDLESLSLNTLLKLEKILEKNNTKKSKPRSKTKANIITRLIRKEVKYNILIELYHELNPLLKKLPQDIYEIILREKTKLEEKDKNNKLINNILTEYFNDFKYNVNYGIKNVNNEYYIDNIFLAKKLSIDREIIYQPEKINLILDMFSKNILGELIKSNNEFADFRERLENTIVDIKVDDLKFEDEHNNLINEIYEIINETKLSYNKFIKNQNNAKNYGITIHKGIENNINNEIKEINDNLNRLNRFESLIKKFPNLEYISSKKYKSISSKKVRSLSINKRKTLKNRYLSK